MRSVIIEKVSEGPFQVPDPRPRDPHVCVAPFGGVRRTHVVSADEPDLVVDDQDLAVVTPVAAQVEEPPAGVVERILQDTHPGRESLEPGRDDQVREAVVDRVDLDATCGRGGERLFEPLADLVALPDVGLEEDLVLGALDRGEHVVVQVLPEGVRRHSAVTDPDLARGCGRERLRLLAPAAVGVDQREHDRQHQLQPEHGEQGALDEPAEGPAESRTSDAHGLNLVSPRPTGRATSFTAAANTRGSAAASGTNAARVAGTADTPSRARVTAS